MEGESRREPWAARFMRDLCSVVTACACALHESCILRLPPCHGKGCVAVWVGVTYTSPHPGLQAFVCASPNRAHHPTAILSITMYTSVSYPTYSSIECTWTFFSLVILHNLTWMRQKSPKLVWRRQGARNVEERVMTN